MIDLEGHMQYQHCPPSEVPYRPCVCCSQYSHVCTIDKVMAWSVRAYDGHIFEWEDQNVIHDFLSGDYLYSSDGRPFPNRWSKMYLASKSLLECWTKEEMSDALYHRKKFLDLISNGLNLCQMSQNSGMELVLYDTSCGRHSYCYKDYYFNCWCNYDCYYS